MFQDSYDWTYTLAKQHQNELLAEVEANRLIRQTMENRGRSSQGLNRVFARLGAFLSGRKDRFKERSDHEVDRADLQPVDQCC